MAYAIFALLWVVLSPLRASCCDGGILEALFYFFPVGAWCTLYTTQDDLGALILAVCLLVGLNYYFGYYAIKRYRKWPVTTGEGSVRTPLRFMRQRFFLITACGFLAVSFLSIVSSNGLEARIEYSSFESRQEAAEDGAVKFQARLLRLNGLRTDRWEKLSTQQRIDTLQALADVEADRLGIPSAVVSTIKIVNSDSAYSTVLNQIVLDPEMVSNLNQLEQSVKCLLWAVHNKYIHYLVDHTDFSSDMANTAYYEWIREYKERENDIINIDSFIRAALHNRGKDMFRKQVRQDRNETSTETPVKEKDGSHSDTTIGEALPAGPNGNALTSPILDVKRRGYENVPRRE